jgi:hypothetical protein
MAAASSPAFPFPNFPVMRADTSATAHSHGDTLSIRAWTDKQIRIF